MREVTDRNDLDRIAAFERAAWEDEDNQGWIADMLEAERKADPNGISIVVAEAGGEIVCAGWVRFVSGTDFATLWGGATLPAWRGRGIYRATVAHRAGVAARRGFRFLEVDASSDSRPILERLGFSAVTTTTPYVWSPSTSTEPKPRGQVVQLGAHGLGHRAGELHVFVNRVHLEDGGLAVGGGVDLPDEPVVVEHREGEVAPAAFGRGLVHLEGVLELEQLLRAAPVVDEPVERRQQRRPPLEVAAERGGVDAPLAFDPLDHGRLPRVADVDRLERHGGGLLPCDAERGEPPLVPGPLRLLDGGDDDVGGVHALGEIPQPLAPDAARRSRLHRASSGTPASASRCGRSSSPSRPTARRTYRGCRASSAGRTCGAA